MVFVWRLWKFTRNLRIRGFRDKIWTGNRSLFFTTACAASNSNAVRTVQFLVALKCFRRTQVTCALTAPNFFSSFALLLLCCRIRLNGITTLAAARGHSVSGRLTMTSYNNAKQLSRNPTADGSDLVLWLLLKVMVEEARFLEQPAGRLAASHSNMADSSECGGCCCWS